MSTASVTGQMLLLLALLLAGGMEWPTCQADEPPADPFPNTPLVTQDGKKVEFYKDLVKGKTVVINFMYSRCDGKVCGQALRTLLQVQKDLGDRLGREVFMYSITLDPEYDTPKVLKAYAEAHGVKPGWTFLTGAPQDIQVLRRKLGMYNSDEKVDRDLSQHTAMIKIGNDAIDKWTSSAVSADPKRIVKMIDRVQPVPP